ncbi:MAG: tetratricopeptide repeat protein [Candidatus Latescibacterota bacterium]|nr:tetratricopeptide repeat protein [Candidatus Latescibacterota bacterium]
MDTISTRSLMVLYFFVSIFIYANTLNNPFHFDDFHSIVENPHLRALNNIPVFFVDTQTFSVEQGGKMFRPLLLVSYAINFAIHGSEVWGYRIFNILLHFSCVVGLFHLAVKMGAGKRMASLMGWLLLINPLVAEPINYISSRSDLFVSSFIIWSISSLLLRDSRYALGIILFAFGFLVKSMAIVMPPLLLLCERSANVWNYIIRKRFLTISLSVVVLLYLLIIYENSFLGESVDKIPRGLVEQIFTHLKAQVYMAWLCVMPVHLTVDHPFNPASKEITEAIFLSILLIGSISIFAIRAHSHWLSVGWIWQIIALLPYAFIPLNLIVTERRMYLAVVGFSITMSWVFTRWKNRNSRASYGFYGLLILWIGISLSRSNVWANDISLWSEAVNYNPKNPRALINLGLAYERDGSYSAAQKHILEGLSLDPKIANGWLHLGNLQFKDGKYSDAEDSYLRALSVQPGLAGGYYNIGNILLGRGEIVTAEEFYIRALEINPYLALAHNNLGQIHESRGNSVEALRSYDRAIGGNPELPQPHYNRAVLLEKMGDYNSALSEYSRAYKLMNALKNLDEINQSRPFIKKALEGMNRLRGSVP